MKIKKTYILLISGILLFILACVVIFLVFFKEKFQKKSPALARANSQYLYYKDIKPLILPGTSVADSADIVNRYIENWLKRQSLIRRALSQGNYNEKEIDQKIVDYKNALMVYDFEKVYIKEKLDTVVTEDELKNYYNLNLNNFQLRQNIVKAWFIKLPANAPKLNEIRNLINIAKDKKKIESYCSQFALSYTLEDQLWKDFDQLIIKSPFQDNQNKADLLKNKSAEITQSNLIFLVKIFDLKKTNQISPLEFINDQVKDIIINKRKVDLLQKLETETYERAKNEKTIELYVR